MYKFFVKCRSQEVHREAFNMSIDRGKIMLNNRSFIICICEMQIKYKILFDILNKVIFMNYYKIRIYQISKEITEKYTGFD